MLKKKGCALCTEFTNYQFKDIIENIKNVVKIVGGGVLRTEFTVYSCNDIILGVTRGNLIPTKILLEVKIPMDAQIYSRG